MAGNLLGSRSKYVYKGDDGNNYSVITDDSLAVAKLGAADAAPVAFDPESPPANYAGRWPRGAETRKVFVEDSNGNRKALTAFDPTASLFATNLSQSVTIDEAAFTSKGRRGERYSF